MLASHMSCRVMEMISPFSIEHPWELHWKRLASNNQKPNYINNESPKECAALDAVAKIGLIGGKQLSRLFGLDKKRLKRMVREQKIVRHELCKDEQIIPIYTLGQVGAIIADVTSYTDNYWYEYQLKDVLKRLLFFQLYYYFPESNILPTPEPFVGAIEFNGKPFYTYVSRGDSKELLMYLKWQGNYFNERLIIVTESLQHIQPLATIAKDMKLRITTDDELLDTNHNTQNLFYFVDKSGKFIKEV